MSSNGKDKKGKDDSLDTTLTVNPVPSGSGQMVAADQKIKIFLSGFETRSPYLIKRTLPLSTVIENYSKRRNVPSNRLRFTFDGVRVKRAATAEKMGLVDGDEIEVFQESDGGAADRMGGK